MCSDRWLPLLGRSIAFALLAIVCATTPAAAQQDRPWNPYGTEVYREGPGVRLGNAALIFHPGAVIEAGYDSNVFYLPDHEVGSALLRVRLHFDLQSAPAVEVNGVTPSANQQIDFKLSTQIEYREYLSRNEALTAQRSINAFVAGHLTIFPKGRVTLRIDEEFIRSVDPRNGEGPVTFGRIYNRAGVELMGRPGSGRLELGVADHVIVQRYEDSDLQFGNSLQNEAQLFARFKLFSRTVLGLTVGVGYIRYDNSPSLEAVPLRVLAEASSPLTSWLEATLALGYGNSLSLRSARFSSAISHEELRFLLPLGIHISVGHRRDFFDSLFASYFVDDSIYVGYQQPFLHLLRFYAEGAVRFRRYEGLVDPMLLGYIGYSSTHRSDLLFDAHAGLSVQARRWLAVGASYNLLGDRTDFGFMRKDGSTLGVRYIKHSVLAQLDFAY